MKNCYYPLISECHKAGKESSLVYNSEVRGSVYFCRSAEIGKVNLGQFLYFIFCRSAEIGRQARLRSVWGNP